MFHGSEVYDIFWTITRLFASYTSHVEGWGGRGGSAGPQGLIRTECMENEVVWLSLWCEFKTCLCLSYLLTLKCKPWNPGSQNHSNLSKVIHAVSDGIRILLQICLSPKSESVFIPMEWNRKGQFSLQSQRKAMPKDVPTTTHLCSSHILAQWSSTFSKWGFNSNWT